MTPPRNGHSTTAPPATFTTRAPAVAPIVVEVDGEQELADLIAGKGLLGTIAAPGTRAVIFCARPPRTR